MLWVWAASCSQAPSADSPRAQAPLAGSTEAAAAPRQRYDLGRALYREAQAAAGRGEFAAAADGFARAAALLPPQPGLLRRHAAALASAGRLQESLSLLEGLVAMAVTVDLQGMPELAPLRSLPGFASWQSRLAAATGTRSVAAAAFQLGGSERDFVPEGIAYSEQSRTFFLSSVRKRRVSSVGLGDAGAAGRPFADLAAAGWGSPLGLSADDRAGLVWAAVSTLPHSEPSGEGADHGRAGVLAMRIDDGALAASHAVPPASGAAPAGVPGSAEAGSAPNDLVPSPDGRLFVSDPERPAIWVLPAGGKGLEPFLDSTQVASPNGLAVSANGETLFVADYALGLLRVDLATRAVSALVVAAGAPSLVGIDGLAMHGGDLIAIQNGIAPPRILRLRLGEGGRRIRAVEVLEMARADWDEPTLGVVVEGALYYVANSHWPRFDAENRLTDPESLSPPLILRLPLEP